MASPLPASSPLSLSKRVLTFPITGSSSDIITVTNTSSAPAAFKVKTTNPLRYVVRPNIGALAPDASVEISIALHRAPTPEQDADLVPGASKDKFLLQAAPAPGLDPAAPPAAFWSSPTSPPGTSSTKLRVAFAAPGVVDNAQGETQSDEVSEPRATRVVRSAGVLPDADDLLKEGNGAAARARAEALQGDADGKAAALAKMRAELAERKAETSRVLDDAPRAPVAANRVVTDPFGGVSVAAVALFFVLLALVAKTVFFGGGGVETV